MNILDRKVITKVLIDPLYSYHHPGNQTRMQNIPNINKTTRYSEYFLEVLPKIERTSPVIPIKEVNHNDSLLIPKPYSYEFPYVSLG